jgi:hypothetical protein
MEMNQKMAELDTAAWAERHPVLDTMGKAGLTGAGVAALSSILADFIEARRQAKKQRERDKMNNSEDAIVFHVRDASEKAAEDCVGSCDSHPCEDTNVTVVSEESGKSIKYQNGSDQMRETNGRFSGFGKSAGGWGDVPVDTLKILGSVAAFPVGYMAVSKIHERMERNRLKKQIAAAQQEYIDLLDGRREEKTAEFCDMFMMDDPYLGTGIVKSAEKNPADYNALDRAAAWVGNGLSSVNKDAQNVSAATLAAALLTSGVSAWVVHKLLAERFDKKDNDAEPRRDMKIMFKSSSADELEISPEQFMATIVVMRDCIRDSKPMSKEAQYYFNHPKAQYDDEAMQHVLRTYAHDNLGVKYDKANDTALQAKLLVSSGLAKPKDIVRAAVDEKEAARLKSLAPDVKDSVMNYMLANPVGWLRMIGAKENRDILEAAVNRGISDMQGKGGFIGTLMGVPVLGDVMKSIMRWYSMNTEAGRRMVANRMLEGAGMTDAEERNRVLRNDMNFSTGFNAADPKAVVGSPMAARPKQIVAPPPPPQVQPGAGNGVNPPEMKTDLDTAGAGPGMTANASAGMGKSSGVIGDIKSNVDFFANMKTLSDMTNKDLGRTMKKTKKGKSSKNEPQVEVDFDNVLMEHLTDEQRRRLYEIAARIAAKRK